jgi:nicotinamidase-related amidase
MNGLALVLVDVINDFEFETAEPLFAAALPAARVLKTLKERAKRARVPVLYVNDNFGKWQSDFNKLLEHCIDDDVRGRPIAQLLQPDADDYRLLKPKHSGFYSTTLSLLLDHLGAQTLVMGGFAMDACVLFTAADAFMRDKKLIIPSDGVASDSPDANQKALDIAIKVMKAEVMPAAQIDFEKLKQR